MDSSPILQRAMGHGRLLWTISCALPPIARSTRRSLRGSPHSPRSPSRRCAPSTARRRASRGEPRGRHRPAYVNSRNGRRVRTEAMAGIELVLVGGEYYSSRCEAVRCDGGMLACLCMLVSSNGSRGQISCIHVRYPRSLAFFHLLPCTYHQGIKDIARPCPCTMRVMHFISQKHHDLQWKISI